MVIFLYNKAAKKNIMLIMTIVAPAGISNKKDRVIPDKTDMTASSAAIGVAPLKPLATCRAVTAGRISRAEISMMPTTLMASTTVTAVRRSKPD